MEHVVFFPAQDGSAAFRRLSTLEEAVRLVEHLRNVEGVDHVSVHALTEVPLEFKAYYKVALPEPAADSEVAAPSAESHAAPAVAEAQPNPNPIPNPKPSPAPETAAPQVPEQQSAKRPASLGFFSR